MKKKTFKWSISPAWPIKGIDSATTENRHWGHVVPNKGGKTLNNSIDPHAIDREIKDMARDNYEPEHERYLNQNSDLT